MNSVRIAIADSQYLTRKGLRQVLSQRQGYVVTSELSHETELYKHLKSNPPDVLILDYNQPRHFTTETVRKVKELAPQVEVLIISADEQKDQIYEVIESGVNCFITKECDETEILDAIEAAKKGQKFFCNKVLDYIIEKSFPGNADDCDPSPLTPREKEIVVLTAKGLIAKEIASDLDLSTHTVYTHKKRIMKKLGLKSPVQLVMYALEKGMIDPITQQ
jgi:DNA-binding NarL/FixJ family response regulator